jgi:hypothetical protein
LRCKIYKTKGSISKALTTTTAERMALKNIVKTDDDEKSSRYAAD